jgi:cyclohexyl-isocyanide hydratase
MNRRELAWSLGAAVIAAGLRAEAAAPASPLPTGTGPRPKVAMLVYPDMVLLDLIGPQTVLAIAGGEIHLVWKDLNPVTTDVGIPIATTTTLANCPKDLDVLFVPGGLKGSAALMEDAEVLAFLKDRGSRAKYVTSVCTGSLVLGAAGLLNGYRATSHWYVRDLLPLMGATLVKDRVVIDRNRLTGGGVTAGIDFGLSLASLMGGEDLARRIQLLIEYAPKPPFNSGEPETAAKSLVDGVLAAREPLIAAARAAAQRSMAGR